MKRFFLTRRGKMLMAIPIVMIVIFAVLVYCQYKIDRIDLTLPPAPSPNAFDRLAEAFSHAKEMDKVMNATTPLSTGISISFAEKERLIEENRKVIDIIHTARGMSSKNPFFVSDGNTSNYFSNDRKLARLIELQADVLKSKGDFDGAAESGLDISEIGVHVQGGGDVVLAALVGMACNAIGRRSLLGIPEKVSLDSAKKCAARMVDIYSRYPSFALTMRREEIWELSTIKTTKNSGNKMFDNYYNDSENKPNPALIRLQNVYLYSSYSVYRFTRSMDKYIEIANLPYPIAQKQLPVTGSIADPLTYTILPIFKPTRAMMEINFAQNRIITLQFALRAYYLTYHAYPKTLAELAPTFIPKIPQDPFAEDSLFRYKIKDNGYLLYSLGPDCIDNGGVPIKYKDNKRPYLVSGGDAIGDIVAGINY